MSLIQLLRQPAAQRVCPTMNSSMMASSARSSNVNNSFPINFMAYTRSGQKDTLFMPQLVGQLKGNNLIKK
ncbi:hypothetical protein [Serratia symbiotica]|uniref:hypothetical protein n=1 Tax=Serratia symbiotica TaxID=138074 RepID=UPI0030D4C281